MASSTAFTTICGSIPFSRLRASITLYSSLAIKYLLPYLRSLLLSVVTRIRTRERDLPSQRYPARFQLQSRARLPHASLTSSCPSAPGSAGHRESPSAVLQNGGCHSPGHESSA